MANTRAGNVIRIDTSANFPDVHDVSAIKYIGNTAAAKGEITITKAVDAGDGSGKKLWDSGNANTADVTDHGLDITSPTGIYVSVGVNGAVIYLYLE